MSEIDDEIAAARAGLAVALARYERVVERALTPAADPDVVQKVFDFIRTNGGFRASAIIAQCRLPERDVYAAIRSLDREGAISRRDGHWFPGP